MHAEVLRYLGWHGQEIDQKLSADIDAAINEAKSLASPRHVWRIFSLREEVVLGTQLVLSGESIRHMLADAVAVALMAVTLGQILDNAISRYSRFDVSHALLLDAAATALTESVCDEAEHELQTEAAMQRLAALPRFSPGYGDFPLELQPKLLGVLGAQRRLGLTVTSSHLLIPRKSVTAIVPLLPEEKLGYIKKSVCANCSSSDCPFPACIRR